MLSFAGIRKKMNSFRLLVIFFIMVPGTISLGLCQDISFSLCWMSRDGALERQNGNLWLNGTALASIRKPDKVISLTVHPDVENKIILQYGGSIQQWTVKPTPHKRFTKVRGQQKPLQHPTNGTKHLLETLRPTEVFACENGTLFFHQDENFFLAIGHTVRLPVKLMSRSMSSLLVSWGGNHPAVSSSHTVTLYHIELSSYNALSIDTTSLNHYRFTALDSCCPYVACVEIAGMDSLICLSGVTDPDHPTNFEVISWNTSSITLGWECPQNYKYSLFLLTTFYLNGTDHITEEVTFLYSGDQFVFTLSDLQPCSRVKFGLQSVCQVGSKSRYSRMVLNDGNSVHSSIETIYQKSFGPDNYTLGWEVRNTSSISMFRVYHEGQLQDTTLITSYTVGGLLPCQQYQARVEALCGDSVLMSARTVTAHTGPRGVSELRYRSHDSTAVWVPSITHQSAVAFLYKLSMENDTTIQLSHVTDTELHLPELEEGKAYILEVWEQCDGQWESERSSLRFERADSSSLLPGRAAGPGQDVELLLDPSYFSLTMVVPWSLPDELQFNVSEARAKMWKIFKDKLQELLTGFDKPVRVEVAAIEPANEPDKTEILFMSFNASQSENGMPLPVEDQLGYIHSQNATNITVRDRAIHWDGPDLCASSEQTLCPQSSLCINTLGSYTCVCQHGHYDVSSVIRPSEASQPVCKEKGLFTQCLDKFMTGGIAKPYLTFYIGRRVDVKLNDGRCAVDGSEKFYYFRTSLKTSHCGTERRVNKTHIKFQNTLTVTVTNEQPISRRDLKVVWKCVYPRHYTRKAQVNVDVEWLASHTLVGFNTSLQLALSMTLYSDESYTYPYTETIVLGLEDTLFIQVALHANHSFISDLFLQLESCWATESPDPQDTVQGVFLQDSCPIDSTFRWLSVNGMAQRSRFSIQMFTMPKGLPLYIHCLANICGPDDNCTKTCTSQERIKRSTSQMDREGKQAAVVSAGPLVVTTSTKSRVPPSYWTEHMTMIAIVAGSIGFFGVTVLSMSAAKAIMTYYEQVSQQ